MRISDWSSDVCSSDLRVLIALDEEPEPCIREARADREARRAERNLEGNAGDIAGTGILITAGSILRPAGLCDPHVETKAGEIRRPRIQFDISESLDDITDGNVRSGNKIGKASRRERGGK